MEGPIVIATLAKRWKMRLAPDQLVAFLLLFSLRLRYGMRMILSHWNGDGYQ
jgi:hypothetical protein